MANEWLYVKLDEEIKNYKMLCELLASMTSYKNIPDKGVNRMALDSCKDEDKYVREWIAEFMDSFRKGYFDEGRTIRCLIDLLENEQNLLKHYINGLIAVNKEPVSKRFNSEYNSAFHRLMP